MTPTVISQVNQRLVVLTISGGICKRAETLSKKSACTNFQTIIGLKRGKLILRSIVSDYYNFNFFVLCSWKFQRNDY